MPDPVSDELANTQRDTTGMNAPAIVRSGARGALWQLLGGGWQVLLQLAVSAVMARLLTPRDFGIFGMAMMAQEFIGRLGALGTGSGVIAKKDLSPDDLSTVFWLTMITRGLLFAIVFAGAPVIAAFFRTPALTPVLWATSLMFLITGAGSVSGMLLSKRLEFGTLMIIQVGGSLLNSALVITFAAVFGLGYWALVLGLLLSSLAGTALTISWAAWSPSLRWNRESFRYMFRYGIHGLGATTTDWLQHNVDFLLVGKLLGPAALGLYEFAYRVPHTVLNKVAVPVGVVLFPTLSRANTSDERLASACVKAATYIALLVCPAMGGLAVLAQQAVLVLWGEQWLSIIIPLQILCVGAALRSIINPFGAIFLCKNRPDLPFKLSIAAFVWTLVCVATLGYFFGLIGVASGMVVAVLPHAFTVWLAFRLTGTGVQRLFVAVLPPFIGTVASSTAALIVAQVIISSGTHAAAALTCGIATGAVTYLATIWLIFPRLVEDVWETVRVVAGVKRNDRFAGPETTRLGTVPLPAPPSGARESHNPKE